MTCRVGRILVWCHGWREARFAQFCPHLNASLHRKDHDLRLTVIPRTLNRSTAAQQTSLEFGSFPEPPRVHSFWKSQAKRLGKV